MTKTEVKTRRKPRTFVLRTIRNGCVKIRGKIYKPEHDANIYNGLRGAFGLYFGPPDYETYDYQGVETEFVILWGGEKNYKARNEEELNMVDLLFSADTFWNRVK